MPDQIYMGSGDERPALTPDQMNVIRLFCRGVPYKKIGEELFISVNTVKSHMQNIYIRLNLMDLGAKERQWRIREEVCPGLIKGEFPIDSEEQQTDLVPVTPEENAKIEEDELAMKKWKQEPLVPIRGTVVNPRRPGIWIVIAFVLGLIAMYFAFPRLFISEPEVAEESGPVATEVAILEKQTVIVTATPLPSQPTQTPIIEQQTVIVVATSIPAAETPAPPPLSIEELYAQNLPIPVSAGTVLLLDDFSIEDTWDISKGSYEDEQLYLSDYYTNQSSDARTHLSFDNFIVEVDARWADGPIGGRYGLGFRFQDLNNYFEFLVSNDGRYLIRKYVNGFTIVLMEGYSDAISLQGVVNNFHLEANGSVMRFFINDQHLGSIEDDEFSTGDIVLIAHTPEHFNSFVAVFDNFVLSLHP